MLWGASLLHRDIDDAQRRSDAQEKLSSHREESASLHHTGHPEAVCGVSECNVLPWLVD